MEEGSEGAAAGETGIRARASRTRIITAFAAVYVIWGSTYLAIRFAIETMPPFLMAGVRFVTAGAVLYAWRRARGVPRPGAREWWAAGVVGALLLLGGNGAVTWAEQIVPSGITALLVAIVPFWIVLFDWIRPGGVRPSAAVMVGLVVGLAGVALLIDPFSGDVGAVHPAGAAVLVAGSMAWAIGSLYSRSAPLPSGPILATGMQMLCGGALLLLAGLVAGEAGDVALDAVSLRSLLALLYLIVFGAIVGYTAYIWLLQVQPASRVATYAYVNPVVAVLLGWLFADEPVTAKTLVAAAIILGAVAVINLVRGKGKAQQPA